MVRRCFSTRRLVLLLLGAIVIAGCGAGRAASPAVAGAAPRSSASSSSVPASGEPAAPGATPSTSAADPGAPAAAGSDDPAAPGSSDLPAQGQTLPVDAVLASACVMPGTTQTITITTRPNSAVGYHAIYSDGKTGFDPGYYGGNKSGITDGTGQWRDTWVVAANAPPGTVSVDVVGLSSDGASGSTRLTFAVGGVGGCS